MRPGIVVDESTILEDIGGFGLFTTDEKIPRGSFIGAYTAPQKGWRYFDSSKVGTYNGKDSYVMQAGNWRWSPTCGRPRPDLGRYPLAAVQEPPVGTEANCIFIPFYDPRDIGASSGARLVFVAVYTARDVEPFSELFVHYGDMKRRNYEVGSPAPLLNKSDIAEAELPRQWTISQMLGDAIREAYRRDG